MKPLSFCRCGAGKGVKRLVCRNCWSQLPTHLRREWDLATDRPTKVAVGRRILEAVQRRIDEARRERERLAAIAQQERAQGRLQWEA